MEQKARPTSAELLQRAMVTPPLNERRAVIRDASAGLTPNTPSLSSQEKRFAAQRFLAL
jgi:hypothetical protein